LQTDNTPSPDIKKLKSLQDLVKVSKNGPSMHYHKPHLNKNAILFKHNIVDCLVEAPGSRYECIYKNLLREFRQYYQTKFDEYMLDRFGQSESFSKNTLTNKIMF
jgi:hypothetical protein